MAKGNMATPKQAAQAQKFTPPSIDCKGWEE